ncbi:hypothetical protein BH23GEM3_BH23GEM3_15660 [soil metagenome]|jgi:outer membrane biogenesis lipoprotein LolB
MKLARTLLAAAALLLVTACHATDPIGPDTRVPDQPMYEQGGQHGSGG